MTTSAPQVLPGPKTLLMGGIGSGKTHALRTYLDLHPKLQVFAILTEPSGPDTLLDTPVERFHWRYIPPARTDWKVLETAASNINSMPLSVLSKLTDAKKSAYPEMMHLLAALANFTCDRCGKTFGPVDNFHLGEVLAVDSLSGLNVMAMNNIAGIKPVRDQSDWGIAMQTIEKFVTTLTSLNCPVVMTAHLEREFDEIAGSTNLMVSTLGKKLAPTLPRFFSDVVLARREGTKFSWSTTAAGIDLKARNLPWADNIKPSFEEIFSGWWGRGGTRLP